MIEKSKLSPEQAEVKAEELVNAWKNEEMYNWGSAQIKAIKEDIVKNLINGLDGIKEGQTVTGRLKGMLGSVGEREVTVLNIEEGRIEIKLGPDYQGGVGWCSRLTGVHELGPNYGWIVGS
jgi:hypothetical protein